ncbi:uncharacterized protein N7483_004848 [Penicillium malachiteum]|uniref:uncharacterized protein n=1 Tax=Penicillium malachiteum TaxID=1324776 RepID=UPI002546FB65|nr:uncharacterized protein N7483_004848 [Penicillium malachiteum]KAJ5730340.1 hypothetical protein N7483_004848 [Penicillium malachiteum]
MAVPVENGHADTVTKPTNGRREGAKTEGKSRFLGWTIIGSVIRLAIWYMLLTPFLRCPSNLSDLDGTSPRVCEPYLIVRSHVDPYVTPYYDTYAAPYVDQARPYVEVLNKNVYMPTSKLAQAGYKKYGAPALGQAQAYGAAQWRAQVTPRIQVAQGKIHQLYLAEVDPYVQQGVAVVSPYYKQVNNAMFTVYWDHLVPFYTRSQPFIGKTYSTSQDILTTHVMPGAHYTWSSVVYFANSSLWPHVTGLYSEQVEPQLVKIGQRLATYREGKRLRAVVEEVENSSEQPESSTSSTTIESSYASSTITTSSTIEVPSATPTLTSAEQAQQDRERIDSDLTRWQAKFAAAADSAIEDLEERLEDIVGALVSSSANGHGLSLSTALESVATKQVDMIKDRINELVESLPEEDVPEDEENAREQLVTDIRASAISVRDRAHALREWSLSFDVELFRRVSAAVNSTLDVLDGIQDLGLQEIGMRWAWMDGVTYKDWANYRAVKAQLHNWRDEIYRVGVNHKSIAEAKAVVNGILDHGMEVAQETAIELVAESESIDSDHAESDAEPENAFSAASSAADQDHFGDGNFFISDESVSSEDGIDVQTEAEDDGDHESMSEDAIEDDTPFPTQSVWGGVAAAEANTYQAPILDDDEQDSIHSLGSKAEYVYSDAYSQASAAFADSASNAKVLYEIAKSQILGQAAESSAPSHAGILSSIESAYSGAVKYATDEFESKIAAIKATPTTTAGPLAQISSIASSRLSEGLSAASEKLAHIQPIPSQTSSAGLQPFVLDAQRRYYEAVGLAHDHYTAFVSTASQAVYGTPTPTSPPLGLQALVEEAGSQYAHASSLASANLAAAVASASSMASSADDGVQGLVDDASSRYHAALSAASASLSLASKSVSSALYGTTPGPLESLSSQASENWESLVSKASEQIYGTPAPYLEQLQSRLPQFEAVQDVVSELLIGKEPSFTESIMSKLRVAYETPYPAAALPSASSYVSETFESASSVADTYASSIPSLEDVMQDANDQLNAAVEAAADAYASASAHVSSAVHGKESGYVDVAKEHIQEIQSKASAAIYGEEPGAVESATSRLAAAVEDAQSQLADLASSAGSIASEAVGTAASHVTEATDNIQSAAASSPKDEL